MSAVSDDPERQLRTYEKRLAAVPARRRLCQHSASIAEIHIAKRRHQKQSFVPLTDIVLSQLAGTPSRRSRRNLCLILRRIVVRPID